MQGEKKCQQRSQYALPSCSVLSKAAHLSEESRQAGEDGGLRQPALSTFNQDGKSDHPLAFAWVQP